MMISAGAWSMLSPVRTLTSRPISTSPRPPESPLVFTSSSASSRGGPNFIFSFGGPREVSGLRGRSEDLTLPRNEVVIFAAAFRVLSEVRRFCPPPPNMEARLGGSSLILPQRVPFAWPPPAPSTLLSVVYRSRKLSAGADRAAKQEGRASRRSTPVRALTPRTKREGPRFSSSISSFSCCSASSSRRRSSFSRSAFWFIISRRFRFLSVGSTYASRS
mmetsp:Transcript_49136/g.111441  ORF Transcript_49136/g.111441 Transcript_49136/m.111441 type:complete len:218 (-) Transcript_49136:627-1280(-)